MSDPPRMRYCRGCNTEVPEDQFDVYKQCSECRLKAFTRKRKTVTCSCGRTLLACSLKIHLRSIYHAEHMKAAEAEQKASAPAPPQVKAPTAIQVKASVVPQVKPQQKASLVPAVNAPIMQQRKAPLIPQVNAPVVPPVNAAAPSTRFTQQTPPIKKVPPSGLAKQGIRVVLPKPLPDPVKKLPPRPVAIQSRPAAEQSSGDKARPSAMRS